MFKGQSCLQISGYILDEFLTEIENLIECQVLFSRLNQTMQPRNRIGGFWI